MEERNLSNALQWEGESSPWEEQSSRWEEDSSSWEEEFSSWEAGEHLVDTRSSPGPSSSLSWVV